MQTSLDLDESQPAPATLAAPWIFSRLAPLKPSAVFDTYWRFAFERQEIFFRRFEGQAYPWSADPILQRHKFTNAYRASDRVSQYLIREVIYRGSQHPTEIFFRTLLFKLFNKIDTWDLLTRHLGELSIESFDIPRFSAVLSDAISRGDRIYSAAYIMPPAAGFSGDRKHDTHLALLREMLATDAPNRVFGSKNLQAAFQTLKTYAGLGDFLAYQFAIDLNYSSAGAFDENEFVVAGPGAKDGIRKCFTDRSGLSDSDVIRVMVDRQQAEFDRLELPFRDLWGRALHLIDCQNLFCEVDKYARVAHPDVVGLTGRTKIKQYFRPIGLLRNFFFPPKWGLAERRHGKHSRD